MAGPKRKGSNISTRLRLNIFSLLDCMSGNWMRGKHGAWYLNGGMHHIMGYAGRGNTFKSLLSNHVMLTAYTRYNAEYGEIYDTEMSLTAERLEMILDTICPTFNLREALELGAFGITAADSKTEDGSTLSGDEFFDGLRSEDANRLKTAASKKRVSPFRTFSGEYISVPSPWIYNVDSFSRMEVSVVLDMYAKAQAGASALNMEAMKSASAKSQIMSQLPMVTVNTNTYMGLTAHAGDEVQMDPYAPSTKKLVGLKGNIKIKRVPENFSFLTNSLLIATQAGDLLVGTGKADKKEPEFPFDPDVARKGDRDLRIIRFEELRGKGGPTGEFIDIIFSQSQGLLVGLTEFYFLRTLNNNFGMTVKGNNLGFTLDLLPEVFFTRKSVRKILRENPAFARAMSITATCAYEMNYRSGTPQELVCSMTDLYDDLKAQGYDWNEILNDTVEYWYFDDQAKAISKPTITAMTLLQMRNRAYLCKQLKTHPATLVKKEK